MPSEAPAGGPYRVVVVEPRPLAAEAFRRLVSGFPELCVQYTRCPDVGPGADVIVFALAAGGVAGLAKVAADPLGPPVVVVSCHDDPQEKWEAFAAGAADFLVEYPDRLEVVARLTAAARRHRRTTAGR